MDWKAWLIVLLVTLNAGWMIFDGTRALTAGDYVTAASGDYAGQLGPWATLVKAIGVEPRSTLMKVTFVSYGLVTLGITGCFVLGLPWARNALIVVSVLGLWYLPIGTAANIFVLILFSLARK